MSTSSTTTTSAPNNNNNNHIFFSGDIDHIQLAEALINVHKINPNTLVKIIWCGNTGSGKSLCANKIAEDPNLFESRHGAEGVTTCCERALLRFSTPSSSKFFPSSSSTEWSILLYNIPGLLEASREAVVRNKRFIAQAFQEIDAAKTLILFNFSVNTGQRLSHEDFAALTAMRLFIDPSSSTGAHHHLIQSAFTIVINNLAPCGEDIDAFRTKCRESYTPHVHSISGDSSYSVYPLPRIRGPKIKAVFDTCLSDIIRDAVARAPKLPRIDMSREIELEHEMIRKAMADVETRFAAEMKKIEGDMQRETAQHKKNVEEVQKQLKDAEAKLQSKMASKRTADAVFGFIGGVSQGVATAGKACQQQQQQVQQKHSSQFQA